MGHYFSCPNKNLIEHRLRNDAAYRKQQQKVLVTRSKILHEISGVSLPSKVFVLPGIVLNYAHILSNSFVTESAKSLPASIKFEQIFTVNYHKLH